MKDWLIPSDERIEECSSFQEALSIINCYAMPALQTYPENDIVKEQCRKAVLLVERLLPTQTWGELEYNSNFWMIAEWVSVNFPELNMNEVIPFP